MLLEADRRAIEGGVKCLRVFDSRSIFAAHADEIDAALSQNRVHRKKNLLVNFPGSSTVFGDQLYLSEGFFGHKLTPADRAAILVHEAVHFWQWRREKHFLYRYLSSPSFRFEMEMRAERPQTFFVAIIGMISRHENMREKWANVQAKNFQKEYLLWPFVSHETIARRYRADLDDVFSGRGL